VPDCAFCHTAVEPSPSLARLFPGGRVALAVTLLDAAGGALGDEDAAAWREALSVALRLEDVAVVEARDGGVPTLRIDVRRVEGPGRTDSGTTYAAVRYDAVLSVGRTEVTVRGAPFVDAATAPREAARNDLVSRIVPIVAY
jgi:hypothetical protein